MAEAEVETDAESDNEAARRTETIPSWKQQEVDEIVDFLESYESIGVVNFTGIPSRQLQLMRNDLHGQAALRISRNTLLIRSLRQVDRGLEELIDYVGGQVGLIGTDDNPFGLYRQLEASKSPAPINAGEVAPNDIVIPAGDTGIDPGPFVGELQQVGAEARIEEGSIRVTEDSVVAEEGDVVSEQLAGVLSELDIEPKEVGLDLRGVYSDGILFEPDELDIDIDAYRADLQTAAGAAQNLSVNAVIPTVRTAPLLLRSATANATGVGLAAAIEDSELLPRLVSTAESHVRSIAARIEDEDALPPTLRELEAGVPEAETDEDDGDATDTDEATPEDSVDDEDDDEDEDDDAGAAGLGDMFG